VKERERRKILILERRKQLELMDQTVRYQNIY